jgi:ATP-dependent protease ClpP protease subunit
MPEIAIYQDIDSATGYGPQMMRESLAAANGQPVTVRLNSQGGNVIDGLACYNLLKQYPGEKTVVIDGMALSIASVIAMAGDRIEIAENSWMMIHNPNNEAAGDGDAMRDMAALLDGMRDQLANTYAAKSGKTPDECRALMAAETWMTGPQAVEAGFADTVTAPLAVAATFDRKRFSRPPTTGAPRMATATYADLKKSFPKAKAEFIVKCLDRNLDLDAARAEFDEDMSKTLAEVTEELVKARAELDEMKTAEAKARAEEAMTVEEEKETAAKAKAEEEEKAAAKSKARGVPPVKSSAKGGKSGGASAKARWNDAVAQKVAGGLSKAQAVRELVNEDPELQSEFLIESRTH